MTSATKSSNNKTRKQQKPKASTRKPDAQKVKCPEHLDRPHKAVIVRVDHKEAEIDVAIAPLVREIWQAGFDTVNSCQDNGDGGHVWIEFADEYSVTGFLNIVAAYDREPDAIYNRIEPQRPRGANDSWIYDVFPYDCGLEETIIDDEVVHIGHTGTDIVFFYSVRFPPGDLPEVLTRLTQYNERRAESLRQAMLDYWNWGLYPHSWVI